MVLNGKYFNGLCVQGKRNDEMLGTYFKVTFLLLCEIILSRIISYIQIITYVIKSENVI